MPINSNYAQTEMEPWLRDIYRDMAERSEAVRKEPYYPYMGQRQAPFSADMQKAFELARKTGDYQPLIEMARMNAERGSQELPGNIDQYMNPYQKNVIENLMHYSNRGFTENILPALESHFVGLGQHGSTRHQTMGQRAARDQQEALNRQIGEQLHSGYESSGKFFNADKARQLEAAKVLPDIALGQQAGRLADVSTLGNVGATQQGQEQRARDLEVEEFNRQRGYPAEALKEQSAIINGMPHNSATYGANQTPGEPRPNTMANIGSIALGLAGAREGGRKAGGGIKGLVKKNKIAKHPFSQSSLFKHPKVGGKHALKKPKEMGRM